MNELIPIATGVASVLVSVVTCVVVVDFITGVLHWAEDTWTAPGISPVLDKFVVLDNIDHHRRPGTIRAGDYWATNRVCIAIAAAAAGVMLLCGVHAWEPYLIALLASQSNQVHLWAHSANPPRIVQQLQRWGILQSPAHHAVHHKRPYATRYCAVTNFVNPMLDAIGFWRGLEWLIQQCGATMYRATPARGGY